MAVVQLTARLASVNVDDGAVRVMQRAPGGPVMRDLEMRAERVRLAAMRQIPVRPRRAGIGRTVPSKRGVDLRYTIVKRTVPGRSAVVVGSSDPIALMVHQGTRPHVIVPRRASRLVFMPTGGKVVFAKRVRDPGTKPNRYLVDNLPLAIR